MPKGLLVDAWLYFGLSVICALRDCSGSGPHLVVFCSPLLPSGSPSGSLSPTLVYTGLATSDRATALLLLLPHRIKVVVQHALDGFPNYYCFVFQYFLISCKHHQQQPHHHSRHTPGEVILMITSSYRDPDDVAITNETKLGA